MKEVREIDTWDRGEPKGKVMKERIVAKIFGEQERERPRRVYPMATHPPSTKRCEMLARCRKGIYLLLKAPPQADFGSAVCVRCSVWIDTDDEFHFGPATSYPCRV